MRQSCPNAIITALYTIACALLLSGCMPAAFVAAAKGKEGKFTDALAEEPQVIHETVSNDNTILHLAIYGGNAQIVELAILVVLDGSGDETDVVYSRAVVAVDSFREKGCEVVAAIVNKVARTSLASIEDELLARLRDKAVAVVAAILIIYFRFIR